jgi:hypothetical protein
LQGSWGNLRKIVVNARPFPDWEIVWFHIDEGMGWENVRNLKIDEVFEAMEKGEVE